MLCLDSLSTNLISTLFARLYLFGFVNTHVSLFPSVCLCLSPSISRSPLTSVLIVTNGLALIPETSNMLSYPLIFTRGNQWGKACKFRQDQVLRNLQWVAAHQGVCWEAGSVWVCVGGLSATNTVGLWPKYTGFCIIYAISYLLFYVSSIFNNPFFVFVSLAWVLL